MASHVSKPLQRAIKAVPVFVDPIDWSDVYAGVKTEVCFYYGGRSIQGLADACPRPCILYSPHPTGQLRTRVAILEECWQEPLGAVSEESLGREGFADIGEFRRYVEQRWPKHGFKLMWKVRRYRFRLFTDDDYPEWGRWALQRLYGDALP